MPTIFTIDSPRIKDDTSGQNKLKYYNYSDKTI